MPTVLVYRSLLLPASETFIKAQVLAYQRWRGVLVGTRLCRQLSLDGLQSICLEADAPNQAMRVFLKLRREFGKPNVKVLIEKKPDLLHAHFGMDAVESLPIAEALMLPMIVTLHGFDINIDSHWWESGKGGLFMRRYPSRLKMLSCNPHVYFVAVSEAIKERAIAFGIPAEKIEVIYIGVDTSAFKPGALAMNARPKRVLFVGRLVEKKGCEFLLRAMDVVNRHLGETQLVIVGDGPQRNALEALARRLSVNAVFLGVLDSDKIKDELDVTRVFCLPSITAENGDAEGLPIVLLEAQAKGVPVVTSARGGRTEGIFHDETGFAFAERDINTLSQALLKLLSDDELAQRMALKAPRFVYERFDIVSCTQKLESYYDYVLDTDRKMKRMGSTGKYR